MSASLVLAMIIACFGSPHLANGSDQQPHAASDPSAAMIPASLVAEHDELHAALGALTAARGKTGAAAREVERVLAPHFAKEEQYVLPPLGLLRPLAAGTITAEMQPVAQLAARLKAELATMLGEHQAIARAVDALDRAARDGKHDEGILFAARLKLHSQNEEEVLYPAAILVGEYVRLKTQKPDDAGAARARE